MGRYEAGLQIHPASSDADIAVVKELFTEYWHTFGFSLSFQNFDSELATLPGKYAAPAGRLALARLGAQPAGCVAMRPLDTNRCEAKRLYVRPEFRGRGLGRTLLEWLIREARETGYTEMLGDTMPVMSQALEMYERIGFKRTEPYADFPTPGAIYLRLIL
ncbi:MAG: GNAT family N-acetyltransferase [Acidobacteriaceae bacterium]|nr:GNAT family N-acetyltransferase [Acidobacteriaceae bacterium]